MRTKYYYNCAEINLPDNQLFIMHSVGDEETLDSILKSQKICSLQYLQQNNINLINNNTYNLDRKFRLDNFSFFYIVDSLDIDKYLDNYNILIPFKDITSQVFNIGYDIADLITDYIQKKSKEEYFGKFSIYSLGDSVHISFLSHILNNLSSLIYKYKDNLDYIKQKLNIQHYKKMIQSLLLSTYNKAFSLEKAYEEFSSLLEIIIIYIESQVSPEFFIENSKQGYRELIKNKFSIGEHDMGIECRFLNYIDLKKINYQIIVN